MSKMLDGVFQNLSKAIKYEDFLRASDLLKMLLEPLRSLEDLPQYSRKFSKPDCDLIREFWRKLFDHSGDDNKTLLQATHVYAVIRSAYTDPNLHALQVLAGMYCAPLLKLCQEQLEPKSCERTVVPFPKAAQHRVPPSATSRAKAA